MPVAAGDDAGLFLALFGPLLSGPEWTDAHRQRFLAELQFRSIDRGAYLLREGQVCPSVPFVLEGSLRVFKSSESGKEITLYRIGPAQSCILSSGCGSGMPHFPASVQAARPTRAAFLPRERVSALIAESASFRDFILGQYSVRMAEVFELVEEVAFRHLDERLALWLAGAAGAGGAVRATHQEIADHLGSSREVVSRLLKDWEEEGRLELSRGGVALLSGFDGLLRAR